MTSANKLQGYRHFLFRRRRMGRDMLWYELFDCMKNDNCPICELVHKRTVQSMDGFLYESVNDGTIRNKISHSNGLCNFHAYMLKDMGDPLAHAIIYTDLLRKAAHNIRSPNIRQALQYQSHEECLFCLQEHESESTYIKAFIVAFPDQEFKKQYQDNGLLCLPHLELVKNSKVFSDKIMDITLEKYDILINQLQEIKRKFDYRYSTELWTEQEKTAWNRAVAAINAGRGLKK